MLEILIHSLLIVRLFMAVSPQLLFNDRIVSKPG